MSLRVDEDAQRRGQRSAPDHDALLTRVRRASASLPGTGRVLVVVGSSDGAASRKSALVAAPGIASHSALDMALGPPTLPEPGSRAYQALSADEQLWLSMIDDWYSFATSRIGVRPGLRHPMMEQFRLHPELHLPKIVRFYCDNPRLFHAVLVELLGTNTTGTVEERREFWDKTARQALAKLKKKTQAAE